MRSPSLASVCLLKKALSPFLSFRSEILHGIVHSVNHIIIRNLFHLEVRYDGGINCASKLWILRCDHPMKPLPWYFNMLLFYLVAGEPYASQHTILYNSRKRPKFVGCPIRSMRSRFVCFIIRDIHSCAIISRKPNMDRSTDFE